MDQELNDRLNNIEKMVSDNNRMLLKMRKSQKNSVYFRIVYWILIIGLVIMSIYFIAPYLGQFSAAYGIGSTNNPVDSTSSSPAPTSTESTLTKLLNQYEAGQKTTP